jgi:hypothetical protein
VHEDVGIAVIRHDEAEALVGLEELHDASLARAALDRRSATRAAIAALTRATEAITAATAARTTVAATAEAIAATEPVTAAARAAITAAADAVAAAVTRAAEAITATAAARTTVATAAETVTAATRAAIAATAEAVAAAFTRAAETITATARAAVATAAEAVARRKRLFRHESRLRSSPTSFAETVAPSAPFGLVALAMVETSVEFVPVPTIVLRTAAPLSLPTIVRTPVFHVHITL